MINERMAEQLARALLEKNKDQEFDLALGSEQESIANVADAFERLGCHVEHHPMYLRVMKIRVEQ